MLTKYHRFVHEYQREKKILENKIKHPVSLTEAFDYLSYAKLIAYLETRYNKKYKTKYFYMKKGINIVDVLKMVKSLGAKNIIKHNYGFEFHFGKKKIFVLKNKFPVKCFYTIVSPVRYKWLYRK